METVHETETLLGKTALSENPFVDVTNGNDVKTVTSALSNGSERVFEFDLDSDDDVEAGKEEKNDVIKSTMATRPGQFLRRNVVL